MDARDLAELALSRLPKPYTSEVVLHVFCEIERTPHLLKLYHGMMDGTVNSYISQSTLNREVTKGTQHTLGARIAGRIDARACDIVGSTVRSLTDIDSGWRWDD